MKFYIIVFLLFCAGNLAAQKQHRIDTQIYRKKQ